MTRTPPNLDGTFTLLLGSMLCGFDIIAAEFAVLPALPLYAVLGALALATALIGGLQILAREHDDLLDLLTEMTC
ncbi:hypothetical protein [Motiliproteus sediminis]|uniref:hypothetical protein n=1 Tax=Motiliproteus sediminis TaxID=1468178 RepID=UPI001AEF45C5|nr:hypothetical protein [Motiliproteus sediminis]